MRIECSWVPNPGGSNLASAGGFCLTIFRARSIWNSKGVRVTLLALTPDALVVEYVLPSPAPSHPSLLQFLCLTLVSHSPPPLSPPFPLSPPSHSLPLPLSLPPLSLPLPLSIPLRREEMCSWANPESKVGLQVMHLSEVISQDAPDGKRSLGC